MANKVALVSDIMSTLTDIETPITKLKILKSLLSNSLNDPDVIQLVEDEITAMETLMEAQNEAEEISNTEDVDTGENDDLSSLFDDTPSSTSTGGSDMSDLFSDTSTESDDSLGDVDTDMEDDTLPTPAELDVGDMSDLTNDNLWFYSFNFVI